MNTKTAYKLANLRNEGDRIITEHCPRVRPENTAQSSGGRFLELGRRIMTFEDVDVQAVYEGEELSRRKYSRTVHVAPDLLVYLGAVTDINDRSRGGEDTLLEVEATWRRVSEPRRAEPLVVEGMSLGEISYPGNNQGRIRLGLASLEETLDYVDAHIMAETLFAGESPEEQPQPVN